MSVCLLVTISGYFDHIYLQLNLLSFYFNLFGILESFWGFVLFIYFVHINKMLFIESVIFLLYYFLKYFSTCFYWLKCIILDHLIELKGQPLKVVQLRRLFAIPKMAAELSQFFDAARHPCVEDSDITVKFWNKADLKLFQERCKAASQRIFG